MGTTALDVRRQGPRPRRGDRPVPGGGAHAALACGLLVLLWAVSAPAGHAQGFVDIPDPSVTPLPPAGLTGGAGKVVAQSGPAPGRGVPMMTQLPGTSPVPYEGPAGVPQTEMPLPQGLGQPPREVTLPPGATLPPDGIPLTELPAPRNILQMLPGPGAPGAGLPGAPCPPDGCPRPDPRTLQRYKQYVDGLVDSQVPLDLVVSQTRLMVLKTIPKRIQIADDGVAAYTVIEPNQISLLGKSVGVTVLTLWFADLADPKKEEILTYHLRVFPDPGHRARLQKAYDALAEEINCLFKDSNVCLKLVGDKIVITGHAHDANEAANILKIVRAQAEDPRGRTPTAARVPVDGRPVVVTPDGVNDGVLPISANQYDLPGHDYVINMLRVGGEQQVMLRVTVAEVNRAAARSIGMNFALLNDNGIAYFANNTGSIATAGLAPTFAGGGGLGLFNFGNARTFGIPALAGVPAGAGGFNNLPVALDNGQIRLAISALRTLSYAKSLAEPNLVTLNGQTATFQAGGQFPVPVVTGNTFGGLQGVSFVPYGVQLSFTPFITDRDRVRLVIAATVSSRDLAAGNTFIGGAAVPSLTSRNFQTTVELREGQTLAVAGLIQNNVGTMSRRVPLIGDIPVLNNLTGWATTSAGEQELVVLVTPELVHPMEPKEVPPLPGADLFEPTDIEFYLLGRIESHFPVDYRSPIRTDWQRLHQYRMMEDTYLPGPHGHAPIE